MKIGLLIVGNLIQFLNMILNKYFIILTLLRVEASLQYHFGVRGSRPGEGQPERLYTFYPSLMRVTSKITPAKIIIHLQD